MTLLIVILPWRFHLKTRKKFMLVKEKTKEKKINLFHTVTNCPNLYFKLQEQLSCLEKENQILKEANEKFVSSAFDLEREREWRQRENQLKVQIAQLEATLKADLGEKGGILDKYAIERGTFCPQKYLTLTCCHFNKNRSSHRNTFDCLCLIV